MTFQEAILSCFRKYATFAGRAPRSEYWYWVLFVILVNIGLMILDRAVFPDSEVSPLSSIWSLAVLLPGLAVSVRRLHDTDHSGWWLLIGLTIIGLILLIVWYCQRGTPGPNRFGPDPLGGRKK
jgi:uncharacterized membrane protein YhaH (DUF805 family)